MEPKHTEEKNTVTQQNTVKENDEKKEKQGEYMEFHGVIVKSERRKVKEGAEHEYKQLSSLSNNE